MSTNTYKTAWWIGLGIASGAAIASAIWHFITVSIDAQHNSSKADIVADSSSCKSVTIARPSKHRSPEDDIPLEHLATLINHPSHELRAAAQRTAITRLLRHRIFAPLHALATSDRAIIHSSVDPGTDTILFETVRKEIHATRSFHSALNTLSEYGWAGQQDAVDDMTGFPMERRHLVPVGTWAQLRDGYSSWKGAWEGLCKDISAGKSSTIVLPRRHVGSTDVLEMVQGEGAGGASDVWTLGIVENEAEELMVSTVPADGEVVYGNAGATGD